LAVQAGENRQAGPPVDWRATLFDGPYCPVVNFVRDVRGDRPDAGDFTFYLREDRAFYRDGDNFTPMIVAPSFPAYLRLEYFTGDGTVSELFPDDAPDARFDPNSPITLRAERVGKPYGADMILAIMSSESLPVRPGPKQAAEAYLPALRSAVQSVRQRGGTVLAHAIPLRTQQAAPREQPPRK
jgi:hypothetical protein